MANISKINVNNTDYSIKDLTAISMTKLWQNANTSSAFAAQTIKLDLSKYDAVVCYFVWAAGSTAIVPSMIVPIGMAGRAYADSNAIKHRIFVTSTTGVDFYGGFSGNTYADDGACIPYRIYGVKGFPV